MEMLQSKEKEIESPSSTNSPLLVEDTLSEILLRIPANCLIGFKCVCKSWFNMIAYRAFIEAHLHHWKSQPGIITNMSFSFDGLILRSSDPRSIYRHLSFNFDDKDVDVRGYNLCLEDFDLSVRVLASCRGLLLVHSQGRLLVCNPITRLLTKLPSPPKRMKYCLYALVHDASIQKYKVVVQDERVRHNRCCYAFTLGHSSSWRTLPMSGQYDCISSATVSANGKLHRLAGCYYTQGSSNGSNDFTAYDYNRSCLYSMDIATEEFMQTPTPLPHPYLTFRLLELNGSLYYLVPSMDGKVDIWVLKNWETMVWNKEHVIGHVIGPDFNLSFNSGAFAVMGQTRHSKRSRLIIQDDRDLVSYELECGEVRRILDKPKGLVSVFSHVRFLHIVHVNSLVNWH